MIGKRVDVTFGDNEILRDVLVLKEPCAEGDSWKLEGQDGREYRLMRFELMSECASESLGEARSTNKLKPKINFAVLSEICLHNSCECHCIGAESGMFCNEAKCPILAKLTSGV